MQEDIENIGDDPIDDEVDKKTSKKRINSKAKGSAYEREVVNKYKAIGYEFAKTSRNASKMLDDSKIDIYGVDDNVQVKVGYNKGIVNYHKIKEECLVLLKKNFPPNDPVHIKPFIVVQKRDRMEPVAVISFEHYLKLLKDSNDLQKLIDVNKFV